MIPVRPAVPVVPVERTLVEVTITWSPALSPLTICVVLSPTTPVCTRWVLRWPSLVTVTLLPRTAWLGTTRPLARETTMSAVALIPALMPSVDWSSVTVTG